MKIEIKEYNEYELRFLRVLVSRELYRQIIIFNYNFRIERYLWHGDKLIMRHPDDKLEFVKRPKDIGPYVPYELSMGELEKYTAAGDYLEAIVQATQTFKKLGIPKGKVIWSDKLEPVIVRPGSIEKEDDKDEQQ